MENKYKGLRIANIAGKGADGCGVQRTTGELQYWASKNECIVDYYAFDKKFSRSSAHDMTNIKFNQKNLTEIIKDLNDNYDIIMFMSYPTAKMDHDYYRDFYQKMYKGITKPLKVIYIHDIHRLNIDRAPYLVNMIANADVVFHFDTDTWFSKTVDNFGLQKINDRLHKYTLWLNFDALDVYRNDNVLWLKQAGLVSMTRWSSLKNIGRTIEIQNHILDKDPSWDCKVYGVERSIGAKFDILDRPDITYINPNGKRDGVGKVEVTGPINRAEGLKKVSQSLFASSFFSLPKAPQNYGNRMEYTQIEIIGVGTIPVFDKHWAQNNKLNDGRYYYDIPYSAIYSDGIDTEKVANQIMEIANNQEEMEKYLKTSYELVYNEFNADFVIPKAIDLILSKGKNPVQYSDYDICEKFVNKEFADKVLEVEEQGLIPCMGLGEIEEQNVYYIDGKKQKLYAKCKPKKIRIKKEKPIKVKKEKVIKEKKVKHITTKLDIKIITPSKAKQLW